MITAVHGTTIRFNMASLGPGVVLSRYVILGRLATGGMAEVWLARVRGPAGFSKTVVLKTISFPMCDDPAFVDMFLGEARLAAMLSHPNIIQIHDLDIAAGRPFIAMEYGDGRNLGYVVESLFNQRRQLDPALVARVLADCCAGLDYAHKMVDGSGRPLNLVHRDVTPENILVTYQGVVKLLDFGIARAEMDRAQTRPGTVRGKIPYLAPEQVRAEHTDARVDVWALGVNLYRLLTGAPPFAGRNELEIMRAIVSHDPPPPSLLRADIPAELEAICMHALRKDPAERLGSAAEFRALLEAWLATQPSVTTIHLAAMMEDLFPRATDAFRQNVASILSSAPAEISQPRAQAVAPSPAPATVALDAVPAPVDIDFGDPGQATREQAAVPVPVEEPAAGPSASAAPAPAPLPSEPPAISVASSDAATGERDVAPHLTPNPPTRSDLAVTAAAPAIVAQPAVVAPVIAPAEAGDSAAGSDSAARREFRRPPVRKLAIAGGGLAALGVAAVFALRPGTPAPPPAAVPAAPVAAAAPSGPTGQAPAPSEESPAQPAAAAAAATGHLTLTANARVDAWVDGEKVGATPLELDLAPGEHKVSVRTPAGTTRSGTVNVVPGESTRKRLDVPSGKLLVRAAPWAKVRVDGRVMGTTPMAPLELAEGVHAVVLENSDLKARKNFSVTIRPGGSEELKVKMED